MPDLPDLRAIRTGLGLSQAELAALLGRDARTVRRWENGERTPPPELWLLFIAAERLVPFTGGSVAVVLASLTLPTPLARPPAPPLDSRP